IRKLSLFLSTTPDDLLERALNEERFDGEKLTRVLAFAPNRRPSDEKIAEAIASGYPIVFHLFGRLRNPGNVAITESDYVDFIAALLDNDTRPRRLFTEIKGRHLLLLGNSFPDWFARIFLRLAKDMPCIDQSWMALSGRGEYVAELGVSRDENLVFFLHHCASKAEPIADIDPPTLIRQLAANWKEHHELKQRREGSRHDWINDVGPEWIFI